MPQRNGKGFTEIPSRQTLVWHETFHRKKSSTFERCTVQINSHMPIKGHRLQKVQE